MTDGWVEVFRTAFVAFGVVTFAHGYDIVIAIVRCPARQLYVSLDVGSSQYEYHWPSFEGLAENAEISSSKQKFN